MDERQANQTLYQKAASVGMTVEQFKQMKEDKEYRDEIKAIEEEEQADEQLLQGRFPETIGSGRVPVETPIDESYVPYSEARHDAESEGNLMGPEAHAAMRARGGMHKDEFPDDKKAYASGFIESMSPGTSPSESPTDFSASNYQTEAPPEAPPVEAPEGDFEGFMPPEAAAGEQADIQRDENDPAVQEFKELNKKAVAGDKEAEEERAKIFEGMPKEEKAMAKEEFGNYYIGPGGYAINLDKVDASLDREAQFKLLQMLPDHAKPYMLGEWGYIDKEDLKNMPESPEYHLEEMKLMKGLEKTRLEQEGLTKRKGMGVEGSKDVATIQTEAQKIMAKGKYANNVELQTMQDHASQTALKMNLDWQALKQSSVEMMAMNDRELRKHVADMQNVTANKEIDEHTNRLIKQISSNESIAKWGIEAKKALQTDAGVLQKELAEMGHNVTREEIEATKDRLTTQLASDKILKKMGIDGSL